jgi:carbon-monoxide dehydrogenase small subunit
MVMSAIGLINDNPSPTEEEIRDHLEGNICRCTGYHNIIKSIAAGGQAMKGQNNV